MNGGHPSAEPHATTTVGDGNQNVTIVHGDLTGTVHLNYHSGGTAEDRVRAGLALLASGSPRAAEAEFGAAWHAGATGPHVVFALVLALLSGRAWSRLTPDERDRLDRYLASAHTYAGAAIDVHVSALHALEAVVAMCKARETRLLQGNGVTPTQEDQDDYLQATLAALPEHLSDDIRRHGASLLETALSERAEHAERTTAWQARFKGNRQQRAPLFFEPDPLPPRQDPTPHPGAAPSEALRRTGSAALAVLAVVAVTTAVYGQASALAWTVWILDLAAGTVAAVLIGELLWRRRKTRELAGDAGTDAYVLRQARLDAARRGAGRNLQTFFRRRLDERAAALAPVEASAYAAWCDAVAARIEDTLDNLVLAYDETHVRDLRALAYLADDRVQRLRNDFDAGDIDRTRRSVGDRYLSWPLLVAAVLVVVPGTAWLAQVLLHREAVPLVAAVLLLVAAVRVDRGAHLRRYLARRILAWRVACATAALAADMTARQARLQALRAARPADRDLGAWLDADLRFLRTEEIRENGLVAAHLLGSLVLTERAQGSASAMQPGLPPRYSAYVVRILLLTTRGVVEAQRHLDFCTGAVGAPTRFTFPYDSIGSARQDHEFLPYLPSAHHGPDVGSGIVLGTTLRVSLREREALTISARLTDLPAEFTPEEVSRLSQLAVEQSGIREATRILISIATEGREWVTEEVNRRRSALYQSQQAGSPGQLGANPAHLQQHPLTIPEQHTQPYA